MTHEGGCLCGAVRWKAEGEPINVRCCHCTLCQKATAAPFWARAVYAQNKVTVEGHVEAFPTSDHISRVFCRDCGVRLFARRGDGSIVGIGLSSFDDPTAYAPTEHIFVSSKVAWLKLDDGLPQHDERPPA